MLNTNGEKVKEQTGVARTNCIDCLDRTNVTQVIYSFLADLENIYLNS